MRGPVRIKPSNLPRAVERATKAHHLVLDERVHRVQDERVNSGVPAGL
jgi:hypothetical protein